MEKLFTVARVIAPIFFTVFLGIYARRKQLLTNDENQGLQQFVIKFGLPCVLFNSCLTAKIGAESLSSMALVLPLMLMGAFWAFRWGRKKFPYHNFPQLFAAQETGMLGIPLFMILFGADQAYRMGVLDLTQAVVAIPTIAILSADAGENPTVGQILKKVLTSPFLIMSLLGLTLNLTGAATWLASIGSLSVITESTAFLAQPVSSVMIFSVGYNFSLRKDNFADILKISGLHFVVLGVFCCVIQAALFLLPHVEPLTRWAILMYCTLPASYLAPGLGRTKADHIMASGVCSLLTVASLIVFCCMAAIVA